MTANPADGIALINTIGRRLRQLRREKKLTQAQLATRTKSKLSQTKLSRIESGNALPSVDEAEAIARALDLSLELSSDLIGMSRAASTEFHDLAEVKRRGIGWSQDKVLRLEQASHEMHGFTMIIPGLLQTVDYMRSVFEDGEYLQSEVAAAVSTRVQRQQLLLYDSDKKITLVMHESALHTAYAPDAVMRNQLEELAERIGAEGNTTIGVVPFRALLKNLPLDFTIHDDRIVLIELLHGWEILTDERYIKNYLDAFEGFRDAAVFDDDAQKLVKTAASTW